MEKLFWDIIEESKEGKQYCPAGKQFMKLTGLLASFNYDTVSSLSSIWNKKLRAFKTPEFDLLHISKGGVVNAGDDGFYLDFPNWVLAQGYTLYQDFLKRKHIAVLEYVRKYNVPSEDLYFENMGYAFSNTLDKLQTGNDFTLGELRKIIIASNGRYTVSELRTQEPNELLGFRVTFDVERVSKGKRSFWSFDIPLNASLSSCAKDTLFMAARGKYLFLLQTGRLFMTHEEIQTGVCAIDLDEKQQAIELILAGIKGKIY